MFRSRQARLKRSHLSFPPAATALRSLQTPCPFFLDCRPGTLTFQAHTTLENSRYTRVPPGQSRRTLSRLAREGFPRCTRHAVRVKALEKSNLVHNKASIRCHRFTVRGIR